MMRSILLIFWMASVFSVCAHAQFYRYTDKDGVIRFTDDLGKIPAEHQSRVIRYQGAPDAKLTVEEGADDMQTEPDTETSDPDPDSGGSAVERQRQKEFERLQMVKKDLDQAFEQLSKEIETLKAEEETLPPHAYNDRTRSLNLKITAYEKRRAQYEKEIRIFHDADDKTIPVVPDGKKG